MPNDAEQVFQRLECVAIDPLVLNLAGGGVHGGRGQRGGGSGSRQPTFSLAVFWIGGFSHLRPLSSLGSWPQTPDSPVGIGS